MARSLALPVLVAAIAGCSPSAQPTPTAIPTPVVATYGVAADTLLSPYPSDRYTVPDATTRTGLRVHVGAANTRDPMVTMYAGVADELNAMDGFSTAGGVIVTFDGPIDIHGIVTDETATPPVTDPPRDAAEYAKKGSPFLLVDVDPKSPEHGVARGIVARWWAQPKDEFDPVADFTLVAAPATPLLPATRYAFVVTKALKAASGGDIVRSAETEKLLAGGETGAYADEMKTALDAVEASTGVARGEVVLATAFTTASVHDEILATAKRARTEPSPKLTSAWAVETPMTGKDPRVRFKATYEAPEYRRPLPDGKWQIQNGTPVAQKQVGLEVFLAFSDATKKGPRPVVIFQHGLGGTKDGCWGTAERLAPLDAAVIAIDSPEHGSRAADPKQKPLVAAFSFFGVDPKTQSFDLGRARDNFRQMASDQLELVRFIHSLATLDLLPVGAPDGVPDLDVSRVLYIGHSFGSVQGATLFAIAPEIHQAVWNVGGDNLTMLMRDSGTFGLLVKSLTPPNTPTGVLARFFAAAQGVIDPGDPINYARFAALTPPPGIDGWTARDVLLQEVIDDGIVPNSTSEALARAAGLTNVDPLRPFTGVVSGKTPLTGNLPGEATGAISQFDVINGKEPADHGSLIFSTEAIAQYVHFFQTGLAAPHATVVAAYPK